MIGGGRKSRPARPCGSGLSTTPPDWPEFKRRYFAELEAQRESIDELRTQAANKTVTLVFGAKDTNHNQAVALKEYLEPRP